MVAIAGVSMSHMPVSETTQTSAASSSRLRLEERHEARAAGLLLALEEHADRDRRRAVDLVPGAQRLEPGHDLALVVDRAARDHPRAALGGQRSSARTAGSATARAARPAARRSGRSRGRAGRRRRPAPDDGRPPSAGPRSRAATPRSRSRGGCSTSHSAARRVSALRAGSVPMLGIRSSSFQRSIAGRAVGVEPGEDGVRAAATCGSPAAAARCRREVSRKPAARGNAGTGGRAPPALPDAVGRQLRRRMTRADVLRAGWRCSWRCG